jgi:hypothetical protein
VALQSEGLPLSPVKEASSKARETPGMDTRGLSLRGFAKRSHCRSTDSPTVARIPTMRESSEGPLGAINAFGVDEAQVRWRGGRRLQLPPGKAAVSDTLGGDERTSSFASVSRASTGAPAFTPGYTMSTESVIDGRRLRAWCANGNSRSASAMGEAARCASNRGFTCVPSWVKPRRAGRMKPWASCPLTLAPEDFVSVRRVDDGYPAVELNDCGWKSSGRDGTPCTPAPLSHDPQPALASP